MSLRRHVRLCREGWYYTIVLGFIVGGAVLREVNLLFVLAAVMMGPLFFSWRLARHSLESLRITRRIPRRGYAGHALPVEYELTNERQGASSWGVVVRDAPRRGPERPAEPPVAVFFPHVAPGQMCLESTSWRPLRRGRYLFATITTSTRFPFGLVEARQERPGPHEVLIAPAPGRLLRDWTRWSDRPGDGSESASQRRGQREGDYYGLREWRPGDSRRWIHWRSSARQGRLTTLQFEDQRRDELVLLADLWIPQQPTTADWERVEVALSFLVTVVLDATRVARHALYVGLAGSSARGWSLTASSGARDELLDALAEWQPGPQPDLAAAWQRRSGVGPSGRLVVVSTRALHQGGMNLPPGSKASRGLPAGTHFRWLEVGSPEMASCFALPDADRATEADSAAPSSPADSTTRSADPARSGPAPANGGEA